MGKEEFSGTDFKQLSPKEKKKWLFKSQKELLDKFLEKKAISREQYERSLAVLSEKLDN